MFYKNQNSFEDVMSKANKYKDIDDYHLNYLIYKIDCNVINIYIIINII